MSDEKLSLILEVKEQFKAAFDNFNAGISKAGEYAEKFGNKVSDTKGKLEKLQSTIGAVAGAFGGMAVLKGSYDEFQKNEQALMRLTKAFENSNGAIGLTKKELIDLRDSIDAKSLFGADEIGEAQAKLVSFGNISGDVFKRTSQAMVDFATASKTDVTSAAETLGKALANPAESFGKLSKQGINFKDNEERMIKTMVEHGNVAGAQAMILDKVESKFKNMAQGATEGSGQIGLLKEEFENFQEALGKLMVDVLGPVAEFLRTTIVPFFKEWAQEIAIFVGVISTLAVAWGGVMAAMAFLNPVSLTIIAIGAAVVGVVKIVQNWGKIIDWIMGKWITLAETILDVVVKPFSAFWNKLFGSDFSDSINKAQAKLNTMKDEIMLRSKKDANEAIALAKKEEEEKLKARKSGADNMAKVNQNEKDKVKNKKSDADQAEAIADAKKAKEKKAADRAAEIKKEEDEIKKKYGFLSKEDRAYLKEKKGMEQEKARNEVTVDRQMYQQKTAADKQYDKDKEKEEKKRELRDYKQEQVLFARKQKLTEKMSDKQADTVMAAEQQVVDEKEAMETKKWMIENNIGNARLQASQAFLGQMSQLQGSKLKGMFEVGKAFAIAEAVQNVYTGITQTIKTYPFPLSVGMAAAQGILGFEQVNQIKNSTPAFERGGGFFGGNVGATTGSDNMTAEFRTGEMYLNARQQRNLFRKIDSDQLGSESKPQTITNVTYRVNIQGNGDKNLKKMVEKTITNTEKRKLQKAQFVKGRFAV